ncbi:DUF4231 domain-containing protein [Phenylobacterium sp.]|uniref:DUF4231 domain-containing protein n=1 Tax=Phenylobacterium sp. TaxID=1871053 RepID=UPI001205812C|nr:DUF4231 domain-containing protein [Phenylobacterium sp.]THD61548.1 MAG: hypothetical protein E8A49_11260 [Phenylobacterium sp.]
MREQAAQHPPRPALTFRLGVTGHRALSAAAARRLEPKVAALLAAVAERVVAAHVAHTHAYRPQAPRLVLISQLAKGADQLAARTGLELGFGLRTVLPFPHATYRAEFTGADGEAFDALLARSDHVWELPGVAVDEAGAAVAHDRGYALAGESTVAQCDILLAIWDGQAARGHGGTADVVEYAIRRGVPVLHLDPEGAREPSVLWSAFGGLAPDRLDRHSAPRRPLDGTSLSEIVEAMLAPPAPKPERAALTLFLGERRWRLRLRPEFPLLMALTGVRRLRRRNFVSVDYETAAAADWAAFYDQPIAGSAAARAGLAAVQRAFAWSDGLADHYAQTYRSALIFNYVAAALSVLLALVGVLAPAAKIWLLLGELTLISLLILNTTFGNRAEWHRRWLDYRMLAEQLRPMRTLALLGAASPLRSLHGISEASWRWTDWYAAATWRDIGPPLSIPSQDALTGLVDHFARQEVVDQVRYNHANAERMHQLDHRLHLAGTALFYLTVALGLTALIGILAGSELVHTYGRWLTVASAGLPTIGAALFGIRGQGDFIGASGRSAETADKLQEVAEELKARPADLTRASRALENAARVMLADLGEWRVSYRHRKLAIPA